jgi:hypothetical protein
VVERRELGGSRSALRSGEIDFEARIISERAQSRLRLCAFVIVGMAQHEGTTNRQDTIEVCALFVKRCDLLLSIFQESSLYEQL